MATHLKCILKNPYYMRLGKIFSHRVLLTFQTQTFPVKLRKYAGLTSPARNVFMFGILSLMVRQNFPGVPSSTGTVLRVTTGGNDILMSQWGWSRPWPPPHSAQPIRCSISLPTSSPDFASETELLRDEARKNHVWFCCCLLWHCTERTDFLYRWHSKWRAKGERYVFDATGKPWTPAIRKMTRINNRDQTEVGWRALQSKFLLFACFMERSVLLRIQRLPISRPPDLLSLLVLANIPRRICCRGH